MTVIPAYTTVELVDTEKSFSAKLSLMLDTFRIRASADGFQTTERTISYGTAPTRKTVTIESV
ncbi:MAG: hypothetical protein F4Z71_04870 [Gammaproteobacteria bacterium]|nr:hypothetical protein [Gammaproteobacteria bacterium]